MALSFLLQGVKQELWYFLYSSNAHLIPLRVKKNKNSCNILMLKPFPYPGFIYTLKNLNEHIPSLAQDI